MRRLRAPVRTLGGAQLAACVPGPALATRRREVVAMPVPAPYSLNGSPVRSASFVAVCDLHVLGGIKDGKVPSFGGPGTSSRINP